MGPIFSSIENKLRDPFNSKRIKTQHRKSTFYYPEKRSNLNLCIQQIYNKSGNENLLPNTPNGYENDEKKIRELLSAVIQTPNQVVRNVRQRLFCEPKIKTRKKATPKKNNTVNDDNLVCLKPNRACVGVKKIRRGYLNEAQGKLQHEMIMKQYPKYSEALTELYPNTAVITITATGDKFYVPADIVSKMYEYYDGIGTTYQMLMDTCIGQCSKENAEDVGGTLKDLKLNYDAIAWDYGVKTPKINNKTAVNDEDEDDDDLLMEP